MCQLPLQACVQADHQLLHLLGAGHWAEQLPGQGAADVGRGQLEVDLLGGSQLGQVALDLRVCVCGGGSVWGGLAGARGTRH